MLTDGQVEELYKELLLENYQDTIEDGQQVTPIGTSWSENFWDDRYDNIPQEEWQETLELHQRKRREFINKLLGEQNGTASNL